MTRRYPTTTVPTSVCSQTAVRYVFVNARTLYELVLFGGGLYEGVAAARLWRPCVCLYHMKSEHWVIGPPNTIAMWKSLKVKLKPVSISITQPPSLQLLGHPVSGFLLSGQLEYCNISSHFSFSLTLIPLKSALKQQVFYLWLASRWWIPLRSDVKFLLLLFSVMLLFLCSWGAAMGKQSWRSTPPKSTRCPSSMCCSVTLGIRARSLGSRLVQSASSGEARGRGRRAGWQPGHRPPPCHMQVLNGTRAANTPSPYALPRKQPSPL